MADGVVTITREDEAPEKPEKPRIRVPAGRALAMTPYQGASPTSQAIGLWRPWLASADADLLPDRDELVARARDLVRNDGAAASAVSRAADLIVGHRWVLAAKPDAEALGVDRDTARRLGRQMEREFRAWSHDPRHFCDRQRRLSFPSILTLMARQWAGPEGEALAIMGWRDPAKRALTGARYATCIDVVDPDRLSNPMGQPDSDTMRGGVELDEDGAPIAAHIRKAHPQEIGYSPDQYVWEKVPWETDWGRPVVLHLFEHERAGQNRGVTRFAPILSAFKQLSQLTESELANAVLNAMFGAFVKTGHDPKAIMESLSTDGVGANWNDIRSAFYDAAPVVMNGLRLPVLLPGDEIQMNTAERSTGSYVAFRIAFLAMVASQLGLSYEQLSMDFSRTNYSSARAALNEVWRTVSARRTSIAAVSSAVYLSVMEEAFDRGYLTEPDGAPAFEERPEAYCSALWIGPAFGSVDPVKDRQAAQIGIEIGLTTLEAECAAEGVDFEDVLDQLEYEAQARAARKLAPATAAIFAVTPRSDMPAGEQPAAAPASDAPASAQRPRVRVPAGRAA